MIDSTRPTPLADLAEVLGSVTELVRRVRPDQWSVNTPCSGWNVRALVTHLVLGHRLFTKLLQGSTPTHDLAPQGQDLLGTDPVGTYRRAVDDLLAAFATPVALDRIIEAPVGPVPGVVAVHLRIVEELTHGWDLARATGQEPQFDDRVVESAIGFTRQKLADLPAEHGPFAPRPPGRRRRTSARQVGGTAGSRSETPGLSAQIGSSLAAPSPCTRGLRGRGPMTVRFGCSLRGNDRPLPEARMRHG